MASLMLQYITSCSPFQWGISYDWGIHTEDKCYTVYILISDMLNCTAQICTKGLTFGTLFKCHTTKNLFICGLLLISQDTLFPPDNFQTVIVNADRHTTKLNHLSPCQMPLLTMIFTATNLPRKPSSQTFVSVRSSSPISYKDKFEIPPPP